jgi:hypothetical protein
MDGLAVVQTFNRGGASDVQHQAGDSVNPGQSFLKIVDLASMQLETAANQAEVRQDVELSVQSPAKVEVVSGLTAGQRVALQTPETGAR